MPDGTGTAFRFAGNGSPNAYVAWARFPQRLNGYANNIGFSRSTDNGATWSGPIDITSDFLTMDLVLGNDRSNTFPSLAVDKSSGPYSGNLYVVYSNNNSVDGADVAFQRSTDQGLTFSRPIFLNARPGADRAQWFPYVTVDRTTGGVWVFYYDQSIASSGDLSEVSYTYSDNGGASWRKPTYLLNPFKAGWGNDTSQPNLGDYIQAVAQFGTFYATYAASMPQKFTDGQPSTSLITPDVFFNKISNVPAAPSINIGSTSFTESSGNGNIDPGEVITLKVSLTNYVTNGLNAGSVTGISATLSTTTPGITVIQGVSTYPAIAPGATATNAPAFVLQTSPSFIPGTTIQFSLAVNTAAGTITLPFTLTTGTPVYTTLINETFDGPNAGAGWTAAHGAGANVVPWTIANFASSICGPSNKAFHVDAEDGPPMGDNARWERFFSPLVTVPANADYVTLDFDVCYDSEDDPVLPVTGYDGFFLRVTDMTPGRSLRSVLAEAFETDFTTDGFQHYPKHLPRNPDPNYFADMSAWAGFSNGAQHVHMKLPGMQGSVVQLRFEYTQDQAGTCADVRPGHTCGISFDNVVLRSVVSIAPLSVNLQVRQSLSRDPATDEIIAAISVTNTGTSAALNVQLTSVLLGNMAPTTPLPSLGTIPAGGSVTVNLRFAANAVAHGANSVMQVSGVYSGGTFNANSRVTVP